MYINMKNEDVLDAVEMWLWKRMLRITWAIRRANENGLNKKLEWKDKSCCKHKKDKA